MERIEPEDTLAFMQGQMAALEIALLALMTDAPEMRAKLATAAGRLATDLAQDAPKDFADGWYHTLRRVNGGTLPVIGRVPD